MTKNKQLEALCVYLGTAPHQATHDSLHCAYDKAGLHDPNNMSLRVKWVSTLHDIVARRCPKNRAGSPAVSDIDKLLASDDELLEAFLKTLNLWQQE